jgi:hypothetical protein
MVLDLVAAVVVAQVVRVLHEELRAMHLQVVLE